MLDLRAVGITVYFIAQFLVLNFVRNRKHVGPLWFATIANSILWWTFVKGFWRAFSGTKLGNTLTFKTTLKGGSRRAPLGNPFVLLPHRSMSAAACCSSLCHEQGQHRHPRGGAGQGTKCPLHGHCRACCTCARQWLSKWPAMVYRIHCAAEQHPAVCAEAGCARTCGGHPGLISPCPAVAEHEASCCARRFMNTSIGDLWIPALTLGGLVASFAFGLHKVIVQGSVVTTLSISLLWILYRWAPSLLVHLCCGCCCRIADLLQRCEVLQSCFDAAAHASARQAMASAAWPSLQMTLASRAWACGIWAARAQRFCSACREPRRAYLHCPPFAHC